MRNDSGYAHHVTDATRTSSHWRRCCDRARCSGDHRDGTQGSYAAIVPLPRPHSVHATSNSRVAAIALDTLKARRIGLRDHCDVGWYARQVAHSVPIATAQTRLTELVERVRLGRQRVLISEQGDPVVALISAGELDELQAAQDAADLHEALKAKAAGGKWVPHDEVVASLAADEAAEPAA